MYITNHIINVHGMTLQMYTKCTLEYKYAMYFVKYIYKIHLEWFVKYIKHAKKCELQMTYKMYILMYIRATY